MLEWFANLFTRDDDGIICFLKIGAVQNNTLFPYISRNLTVGLGIKEILDSALP